MTNAEKIIQIIPAPQNMKAVYADEDGSYNSLPVSCLALTDGGEVEALCANERIAHLFAAREVAVGFTGYAFIESNTPWHRLTNEELNGNGYADLIRESEE